MRLPHWKKLYTLLFSFLMMNVLTAQEVIKPENNFMYSSGRIYVVIAVMLTILAGLIFYLIRLDNKISQLEKEK